MPKKIRVAIVVSHPIQHYVHLYRALAAHPSIDLRVIFASDIGARRYFDKEMNVELAWKSDPLSGYQYTVLPESPRIQHTGFWSVNNPSVTAVLADFQPDVVQIHGYAQITMLRALAWCRLRGIPVLLWSDSSLLFKRSWPKRVAKRIVVTALMRSLAGVLSTGDSNTDYYRHFGVRPENIFRCPFTVDEELLNEAQAERESVRKRMRERYGIPEDSFLILFVGKLIPLKRTRDILDSLLLLRNREPADRNIMSFFAGDGPLRSELEEYASRHGLAAIFGGFINVDQLPSVYAMADILVFPSDREAYGLAAREAICVGLPLVVSDQIGCIGPNDAARPEENAIRYPAGDTKALSEAFASLIDKPDVAKRMGEASLRIAAELNKQTSVSGFVSAVVTVTGNRDDTAVTSP